MPTEDKKMIYYHHGTPIYYTIKGEGPHLVLLHGFLESSQIWSALAVDWSKRRTVVTIDLPGHGKSGVLDDNATMENMATAINSVLSYNSIKKATVLGHSMGGYVALALAELFPDFMDGLILLNSTTLADSAERKLNRRRAVTILDQNPRAFISMAISNLFTSAGQVQFASEIARLKDTALGFPVAGIQAAVKGMMVRKDRTQVLHNFRAKKLLITGGQDPIVPLAEAKNISKKTNTKLVILDGGHMSWCENEQEIVKVLHLID